MNSILILALILFGLTSFYFGKSRIKKVTTNGAFEPKALPHFYGYYQALWCALPALVIISIWTVFEPLILKNLIESKVQNTSLNELSKDELNLIYVPDTADIKVGDQLMSSGLGSRYPKGYPLGEIIQVEHDPGQPFALVKAKPSAYLDRSRYVLLVFSLESELPNAMVKQEPEQ